MLDAQKVTELLSADDLLPVIWKGMSEIWSVKNVPDDLKAFYDEREAQMCQWEQFFAEAMPELFDELLERATKQSGGYVHDRLTGNSAVIIADSLSIRETMLLSHWLPELKFNEKEPFAVVPFPTVTESLAQLLLRTNSPSAGKDTNDFTYRYIARSRCCGHPDAFGGLSLADLASFARCGGGWYALRGRCWWAEEGQNARHTAHGGFSLAEGLVPLCIRSVL